MLYRFLYCTSIFGKRKRGLIDTLFVALKIGIKKNKKFIYIFYFFIFFVFVRLSAKSGLVTPNRAGDRNSELTETKSGVCRLQEEISGI